MTKGVWREVKNWYRRPKTRKKILDPNKNRESRRRKKVKEMYKFMYKDHSLWSNSLKVLTLYMDREKGRIKLYHFQVNVVKNNGRSEWRLTNQKRRRFYILKILNSMIKKDQENNINNNAPEDKIIKLSSLKTIRKWRRDKVNPILSY